MVIELPDASDLSSHVHFNPEQGKVWLDEQRGILQTLPSLASKWREVIKLIGLERSRKLYMRSGFRNGQADAQLARMHRPDASITDLFLAGPQLHMLRGMTKTVLSVLELGPTEGDFLVEVTWIDSYEVDISLAEIGVLDLPVCWSLLGYACGFSSCIMGFDILFKEVSCRGCGDNECRIIGKPLAQWEDAQDYEIFTSSDSLIETLYDLQEKAVNKEEEEDRIFSALVGESKVFKDMCAMANKVATSRASVLLTGETGVGKEMIAKGIHLHSERTAMPFIALNCAAIPPDLIEAELFGVEKGAFTGATHARKGRFERAHKGTIFLDEVAELSSRAQSSLLRVLQEREFEAVGGTQVRSVDVRVIAATNEDLEDAVKQGRFRADLFYRLCVFPLHVPPLRERHDDIPLLAEFFIEKYESLYTTKTLGLTDRAMGLLLHHSWPGNIRELENTIERGVILTEKNHQISSDSLLHNARSEQPKDVDATIDGLTPSAPEPGSQSSWSDTIFENSISMEAVEVELVNKAMALSDDNVSKAARLLGLSRPAFAYRLSKLQTPDTE